MQWKLAAVGLIGIAACSFMPASSSTEPAVPGPPPETGPVRQPGDLDVTDRTVTSEAEPAQPPDLSTEFSLFTDADGRHWVEFPDERRIELPAGVCLRNGPDWNEVERSIGRLLETLLAAYGERISGWPTTTIASLDQPGLELVEPEGLVMMALAIRSEVEAGVLAAIERWEAPYGGDGWSPPRLLSDAAQRWQDAAAPLVTDISVLCEG